MSRRSGAAWPGASHVECGLCGALRATRCHEPACPVDRPRAPVRVVIPEGPRFDCGARWGCFEANVAHDCIPGHPCPYDDIPF